MERILADNVSAVNHSFLYYLHEENRFNLDAFNELLQYLKLTEEITIHEYMQISFIFRQTMRHIIYHFDDSDSYRIENFPADYWEYIEEAESEINRLRIK